ncbi:MAG: CvpA family protein [Chitinophagaceae bacterium]
MNWIDILLLVIILLAVIAGWSRGFIHSSITLFSWLGSLVLGYCFYPYTASVLDNILNLAVWLLPLSFLLTTFIARIGIGFLAGYLIRSIPGNANHNPINKILGIIPGAVNGLVYSIIISALLLSLPLKHGITEATRSSKFAGPLAIRSEWANRKLAPVFEEAVRQTMNSLTVHPQSGDKVSLPFKFNEAEVRADLEAQMLVLVNKERTSRGLKPVMADPEMTKVARAHSSDMFVRGYFAHLNLDGKDPFDRMKTAGVKFRAAGENLALAQTLEMAHSNLMHSPGHKANILSPSFGRLGIGILDGGYYGLMISQEFRD